jgi:hypothetical protein
LVAARKPTLPLIACPAPRPTGATANGGFATLTRMLLLTLYRRRPWARTVNVCQPFTSSVVLKPLPPASWNGQTLSRPTTRPSTRKTTFERCRPQVFVRQAAMLETRWPVSSVVKCTLRFRPQSTTRSRTVTSCAVGRGFGATGGAIRTKRGCCGDRAYRRASAR